MKYKILTLVLLFFTCAASSAQANTYIVNSNSDGADTSVGDGICADGAGNCTLRAAIEEANFTAAADTINFAVAPFDNSVKTIQPAAPLPEITQIVTINGYTQPGTSVNTLAASDNAVLLIELDGTNAGAGANGLRLTVGDSSIKGLIINRFSRDGISINGGDDNNISGNFIGTNATGMLDFGNGGIGVEGEFGSGANGNVIGGWVPADRNIISGNNGEGGIVFNFAGNNVVLGNFVGLAADGATAIGNTGFGVVFGAFTGGSIIGGDDAADGAADGAVGARNYISGNGFAGVFLGGAVFGGCTIRGNFIGTDTTGTLARGNGAGIGSNIGNGAIIGGTTAGAGNLVSGNTGDGMNFGNTVSLTVQGNYIGTKADGATALGNGGDGIKIYAGGGANKIGGSGIGEGNTIAFNTEDGVQIDDVGLAPAGNSILGNSIFSNGGLGINLSVDGVTPNDTGDPDSGANNRQNFPVITLAQPGATTRVAGSLNSTANVSFRLEFFNTANTDASGYGEGKTLIGFVNVTTDGAGNASFDQTFAFSASPGSYVAATATNLSTNETSEFSNSKQVLSSTAATVTIGGRVLASSGGALVGARILLTDSNGNLREARANSFGFYRFNGVEAGAIYVLSVSFKRFNFAPQVLFINDARDDLDFIESSLWETR